MMSIAFCGNNNPRFPERQLKSLSKEAESVSEIKIVDKQVKSDIMIPPPAERFPLKFSKPFKRQLGFMAFVVLSALAYAKLSPIKEYDRDNYADNLSQCIKDEKTRSRFLYEGEIEKITNKCIPIAQELSGVRIIK